MSSPPSTPSSMSLTDVETDLKIHPDYAFTNTDLVLLSSDGVQFYIHSVILQLASSAFSEMLVAKYTEKDGPVALAESSVTLSILLDILYPARSPPSTTTLTEFRAVAAAAEKYDIAYVTDALKNIIIGRNSSTRLRSDSDDDEAKKACLPIEAYFAASDLGWDTVANELSTGTLSCDLNSDAAQGVLFSANTSMSVLRDLLWFHRERKIWIFNAFLLIDNDTEMLGSEVQQSECEKHFRCEGWYGRQIYESHERHCRNQYMTKHWNEQHQWWKFKVFRTLEGDVSGVQFLSDDFYKGDDRLTLPCCKTFMDTVFKNKFRTILDRIPKTIKEFRSRKESSAKTVVSISDKRLRGRKKMQL